MLTTNNADTDEGFGDINADNGYDIDLVKEELEYYKKKESEPKDEGDLSDNDSAIDSARVWHLPVPLAERNSPRKNTSVCIVSSRTIALKNLHKVELLRYRACAEQYILTKERLLFHFLEFIDLPKEKPSAYEDPSFYTVCNGAIVVDTNYQFREDDPLSQYSEEQLVNLATPYFALHVELREIARFADKLEANVRTPAFWQVFLEYTRQFFACYSNTIAILRHQKRLSIASLLEKTSSLRECVQLLYEMSCAWFETRNFDWLQVELAWNNLFVVMDRSEDLNKDEILMVTQLEQSYCQFLLRIMDHIYSLGSVPRNHEKFFILYNDTADPELLITRSHSDMQSLLWNDSLLLTVLRGSQARFRLGPELDVTPVFSTAFYDSLKALGWSEGMFFSFQNFKNAFEMAAQKLTHELSNKLLSQISEAGLHQYWQDMKEITCGRVAHCFAAYVYGCTSDPSKIVALDLVEVYNSALLRSGIPPNRAIKWRLATTAISETDHSISCDLERPLNYVIRPTLIPAMNACMDNMFKIFRVVELLTSVSSDRKKAEDYERVCDDRKVAERRVRHMFFIVHKLLSLVTIIKDLFVEKVSSIFDRHAEALSRAEEVEEVDEILAQAESELQALMARTDIRKQFHEIVDILKRLAEEIRLKSVSNDLASDTLLRWHKTTVRTVEFLALIGAAIGTMFDIQRRRLIEDWLAAIQLSLVWNRSEGVPLVHVRRRGCTHSE
ncbi:unnamed protein product [Cylicocyclus nassatus]|uniref:Uncharacterized protein n=1 Tax=Cylicocyclus nassatus TaxID=53992 RepID=A0AA36MFT4_CYLNA|nr:unnamed protein product [Cylicocyclus nassatus]